MNTQHTPGEWTVHENKFGWAVEAPGSSPSSRVTICQVHETSLKADEPNRAEHDAALIASAPSLLADNERLRQALNGLLRSADKLPDSDCIRGISEARAALSGSPAVDTETERLRQRVQELEIALTNLLLAQGEMRQSSDDLPGELRRSLDTAKAKAHAALAGKGDK